MTHGHRDTNGGEDHGDGEVAVARQLHKLTALAVARATRQGIYYDGGGLELQVTASGARSWIFRYQREGQRHEMGLGGAQNVPLARACPRWPS